MPRCFPAEPTFPEERHAERRVWEALRDQLPPQAALFHSVGLLERHQEYEADLVVAWPGVGIEVLEVKGGQVTREDGQWWPATRAGWPEPDRSGTPGAGLPARSVSPVGRPRLSRRARTGGAPCRLVLAVNGFRDPARAREMLYVGLSRARSLLVVCGGLDGIAAVGGEGVRAG